MMGIRSGRTKQIVAEQLDLLQDLRLLLQLISKSNCRAHLQIDIYSFIFQVFLFCFLFFVLSTIRVGLKSFKSFFFCFFLLSTIRVGQTSFKTLFFVLFFSHASFKSYSATDENSIFINVHDVVDLVTCNKKQ